MKLEKIILRKFMTLIIVASIALGTVFTYMSYLDSKRTLMDSMERVAIAEHSQLDGVMEQVSMVSKILLSNPDTLAAIINLSKNKKPRGKYDEQYFNDNYSAIRSTINNYFITEKFYRVLFFNDLGDVVHGTNLMANSIDTSADWKVVPGIEKVMPGDLVMMKVHPDEWSSTNQREVISFIKRLVGSGMGYIEVEMTKENFEDSLITDDQPQRILICDKNGEVIFCNIEEPNPEWFGEFRNRDKKAEEVYYDGSHLIGYHWCSSANAYIILAQDINMIHDIIAGLFPYLLIMIAVFAAFLVAYSNKTSKELASPLQALRNAMQKTEFENMDASHAELEKNQYYSEEIDNLYQSYEDMMSRLKKSRRQERYMSMLQLQAQMDLLQAQVNPHFIYNVLNVISAKGFMADDESICDICSCLGRMLRYSTNTKEKLGTVREETEYLQLYLNLLKYRYEHRLQYKVDVAGEILQAELPKIVLQQIVENSVTHGYTDKTGVMNIELTGHGTASEWTIHVKDDGDGMLPEKKDDLYCQFEQMRRKLSTEREHVEMEIGGMGLLNTYARLYLVYGERMRFTIDSGKNGTDICIEVRGEDR